MFHNGDAFHDWHQPQLVVVAPAGGWTVDAPPDFVREVAGEHAGSMRTFVTSAQSAQDLFGLPPGCVFLQRPSTTKPTAGQRLEARIAVGLEGKACKRLSGRALRGVLRCGLDANDAACKRKGTCPLPFRTPFVQWGKKPTLLYDSPLCRDGIVVIKFTKSRKLPRHWFYTLQIVGGANERRVRAL